MTSTPGTSGSANGVSMATRLAKLRGALPAEEPGARGLERVARNLACQRLRALTMAGVTPGTASKQIYHQAAREGQSPLAIQTGNRFEARLSKGDAERLRMVYEQAGRLAATDNRVVSVPELVHASGAGGMALRRSRTLDLLGMKIAGNPDAPAIILKPRIRVRLLGVDHDIEPDALIAAATESFYRVVEIKSYPDRGGKSDPADVKSACRQAAVGVIALRQTLGLQLAITAPSTIVLARGDLILRRPGSFHPTLREMSLEGEAHSLARLIEETPHDLTQLEQLVAGISADAALDTPGVLDQIPTNYQPQCREFCALAAVCKQRALDAGDPVILGTHTREALASAGSVARALELMRGTGAPPTSPQQAQLAERLREALSPYQAVVPYAS